MIYAGRAAVVGVWAVMAAAGVAHAEGNYSNGEPVPQGPPVVYSDKGFAPRSSAGPVASMPDDSREAYSEPQFVNGDPYGRSDYIQDGRGNRVGTHYGPGFYEKGYYYPSERQFPDYTEYDERRGGTLYGTIYKKVIDPFVPDQREIDFVRALPVRVITKLRLDEDFRRLQKLAKQNGDDAWAGGRYDSPRSMK